MTPLLELQLLEAFRGGDQKALGMLLEGYQRRIFSVCYRMLGNPDEAADLAQDSLVRVMEGLGSYDGRSKLSTWIIRVTMNCCLSHLRKQKLRRHASLDQPDDRGAGWGQQLAATGEPPGPSRIEQDEMQAVLLEALTGLDPQMRAVLVLRDLQDLDYQQIALVMDLPVGTVKSRLFRARAALREFAENLLSGQSNSDQKDE